MESVQIQRGQRSNTIATRILSVVYNIMITNVDTIDMVTKIMVIKINKGDKQRLKNKNNERKANAAS